MELTYLGTNALLIKKSGSTIMIDPHFTRARLPGLLRKIRPDPRAITAGLAGSGVQRLDGILLTHTHYDHALDAAEVHRQVGGVLYGCESPINLVNPTGSENQRCVQITPGTAYQIGAFQVVFHPSRHLPFPALVKWLLPEGSHIARDFKSPAWFWDYRCGRVSAIQVDRTLIFGSAGYAPGAYQNLDIENVLLGIGGLDLQPRAYLEGFYREAVLHSGAKNVFLSHWDNFFKPASRDLRPHFLVRRAIPRIKALGTQHGQSVERLQYRNLYLF